MKHNRFFRILAAAVILSLLMIAIPITPALGAFTFIISPSTGPTGTALSMVSGTGFLPGISGYVWFDTNGNSARDTGEPTLTATTDGTGNLSATGYLTVPTVPRGIYYVQVDVPAGTPVEISAPFVVTPTVTPSVSTANVGDIITVSGTGFAATVGVTILFDGVSKGTATTTASGTFTGFTFTVPATTEGYYTIKAQETLLPAHFDTASLTVEPEITINPTLGAVGDTIVVTGDGFDASSTVTISFDGTTVVASPTPVSTDTNGTLTSKTFTVPAASRGSHTVRAQDAGGNYATATFTVSAKITLNPTSGPSGTTVTVTGNGFGASQAITIKYNNVAVTTTPSPLTTNSAGNFTATFTVPVGDAGTYVVVANDTSANTATANFVSTTSATISQTTTDTAPGNVGMSLTIEGVGFTPETLVTVTYATDPVVLATVTSDPSGDFEATFTIPPSVGGPHVITVSDGTITMTFDFFMEQDAPPTPELVSPAVGEKADSETVFDWSTVDDVSPASDPVTYDIQVSTTESFATGTVLIDETGLADSTYTLPSEDKLESTGDDAPYYWQVRAVDAASNESGWSEPSTFTVGFSFAFTGWVVWVTIVVVALAFFFFGLWIGRRRDSGDFY
ncbi:MAG: hypothetical protein E3J92_01660 [Dehalococcoidia bacterium]|nr:MAG: hypothetical protein E3J92_01660 [Dehalococcoidia bacterium]